MKPALEGKVQDARPFLYREFPGYGGQQSVRVGEWKAVRQNLNKGPVATELYNIRADESETSNVAEAHPDIVAKLYPKTREAVAAAAATRGIAVPDKSPDSATTPVTAPAPVDASAVPAEKPTSIFDFRK